MAITESLHELLPWHVNGTLGPDEAAAFRKHLDECPACRHELDVLERARQELERHGAALLEDHPSSARIVAAARGELGPQDVDELERHLALCDACAAEVRWVRGESTAGSVAAAPPRLAGSRREWWGWAAAAAAAVALLVLGPWAQREASVSGVVRPTLVSATARAEGSANVPRLAPGASGVRLIFEVDFAAAAFPATLEINDSADRSVLMLTDLRQDDMLQTSYLFVDCSREDCPPGRYRATLHSAGGVEPDLHFAFEVAAD